MELIAKLPGHVFGRWAADETVIGSPQHCHQELTSLMETTHLLRSPKNAERLLTALARAQRRTGSPQSVEELRREVGLDGTT